MGADAPNGPRQGRAILVDYTAFAEFLEELRLKTSYFLIVACKNIIRTPHQAVLREQKTWRNRQGDRSLFRLG